MKAVQIAEYGGPEALKYQDVPDPTPGEGQAVVDIQAVGVNFTDVYSRSGINPGPALPRILGVEAAGAVRAVGPGVTGLQEGDLVAYCSIAGSYAEQQEVPASRLIKINMTDASKTTITRGLLPPGVPRSVRRRG